VNDIAFVSHAEWGERERKQQAEKLLFLELKEFEFNGMN
jgi:hypothetical protein